MERGRTIITEAPTFEPITSAELIAHLVLDPDYSPTLITGLIATAREYAEIITRRAIPTQKIKMTLDRIPSTDDDWWDGERLGIEKRSFLRSIELLRAAPLATVESFTAYDDSDNATVFDASNYIVDKSDPDRLGRICLRNGAVWPIALRASNAIEIIYTAGWANGATPASLKRAIMMMAAWLYNNRGDCEQCANGCGAMDTLNLFILRRL